VTHLAEQIEGAGPDGGEEQQRQPERAEQNAAKLWREDLRERAAGGEDQHRKRDRDGRRERPVRLGVKLRSSFPRKREPRDVNY
jgi:hypothetical protein